jgi:hypothetical protein
VGETKFCQSQVLIISYEMLMRTIDVVSKLTFDLVICDEGGPGEVQLLRVSVVAHIIYHSPSAQKHGHQDDPGRFWLACFPPRRAYRHPDSGFFLSSLKPYDRLTTPCDYDFKNDLSEFFAIVEFCNPGVLGSSNVFTRVFEQPIVQARQPGATKTEQRLGQERGTPLF